MQPLDTEWENQHLWILVFNPGFLKLHLCNMTRVPQRQTGAKLAPCATWSRCCWVWLRSREVNNEIRLWVHSSKAGGTFGGLCTLIREMLPCPADLIKHTQKKFIAGISSSVFMWPV